MGRDKKRKGINGKAIGRRFLFLPVWALGILILLSAAALIIVFSKNWENSPFAYGSYVFSFYTLTVVCIACFTTIPGYYRNIKVKLYENAFTKRYLTDTAYKTHVGLWISLAVHFLYVTMNAFSAYLYRTYWFAVMAFYYAIMAFMRFWLAWYMKKNPVGGKETLQEEWRRARSCMYILLMVNLALSGVVFMMMYYDRGFTYRGYFIYVIALYTFYTTIAALKDLIRYRKYHSPILSVSKIVKLTSCLFSMLFLETAMFSQFGMDTPAATKKIMIAATGAGISVIVVGISFYMIHHSTKEIKKEGDPTF